MSGKEGDIPGPNNPENGRERPKRSRNFERVARYLGHIEAVKHAQEAEANERLRREALKKGEVANEQEAQKLAVPEVEEITWFVPEIPGMGDGPGVPASYYSLDVKKDDNDELERVTVYQARDVSVQVEEVTITHQRDAWVWDFNTGEALHFHAEIERRPHIPAELDTDAYVDPSLEEAAFFDEVVQEADPEKALAEPLMGESLFILETRCDTLGGGPPEPRDPMRGERRSGPGTPHRDDVLDKPGKLVFGAGARDEVQHSDQPTPSIHFEEPEKTIFERNEPDDDHGLER